jgi:hypothetical protein
LQGALLTRMSKHGIGIFRLKRILPLDTLIAWSLKCAGLYKRGIENFKDIRVVENRLRLPNVPASFSGIRLLHLSDLHLDLHPGLTDVIIDRINPLDYDVALITGDFCDSPKLALSVALTESLKVIRALRAPVIGVLGNHDPIEIAPCLEAAGARILLNENWRLRRGGDSLFFAGVDDPTYFRTEDIERARRGIDAESTAILLSHGPSIYREAAAAGFGAMLSGHTHGGQICLPGGFPPVT